MATIQELSAGLVKADAAGNTADAKVFADAIRSMQGQQGAPPGQPTGYDAGLPAQGLSGVNEGIANALGAPVDLTNLALRGGAAGLHALGGPDIQLPVDAFGGSGTLKSLMGPAIKAPTQDAGGQMVRRIGQEVGATMVPGMGALARSATPIRAAVAQIGTSVASGAGAAVAQQVAPNNPYVELAGQILGGAGFGASYKTLQKIITPLPIDARRAAMNDIMRQNGVDLTAGQASGRKGLQYAESELGGTAAAGAMDRQAEQFTSAALSRAGVSAPRATPEVMDKAFSDIGDEFQSIAARNTLVPDRQLGTDLSAAASGYNGVVSKSNRAPVVESTLRDIVGYARAGQMTGAQYGDMRSRLNAVGRSTARTDPKLSEAAFDIQHALDDAMERSMAATSPDDLGALRQARRDYKNMIVIEDAVGRAGEAAANGLITPGNLRGAVQRQNKRSYVRGKGDLSSLARAGVATMSPLPQSGTAPRTAVRNLGTALPSLLGSGIGSGVAGIPGAIAGAAAGAAVPYIAGRALLSGPGKAYLGNQWWKDALGLGPAQALTAAGAAINDMNQQGRR